MAKKPLKKITKKASAAVSRVKPAKASTSLPAAKKSGKPVKANAIRVIPAKAVSKEIAKKDLGKGAGKAPKNADKVSAKSAAAKSSDKHDKHGAKLAAKSASKPAEKSTDKPNSKSSTPVVVAKGAKSAPAVASPANGKKSAKPAPIEHPKNARIILMPRAGAKPISAKAPTKVVNPPSVKPEPPVVRLPPAPVTSDSKMQKNRAGFSSKELEVFRDMLLAKRRELLGDMTSMEREALRSTSANLSNLPVHMADMGTDNYEQEFTLGLVEKDRQLLKEINVALAKIQDGSYGLCEGTGKPISKARLEAYPWARHSIEYARQKERPSFGAFRRPTGM